MGVNRDFLVLSTILFTSSVMLLFSDKSLAGTYSGGSGVWGDSYRISTADDWVELMSEPDDWSGYFIMKSDIDLSGKPNILPVGRGIDLGLGDFEGVTFSGVFDGDGHVVSNVTMDLSNSDYVGLFGYIDYDAEIKDLGVVNVNIVGRTYVGGLAARNVGMITDSYATGEVTGSNYVGGLVGNNDYIVWDCYSTSLVTGNESVGGLVGWNFSREIRDRPGYFSYATVRNSYAKGDVVGIGNYIGGLVGEGFGTIDNSYSNGDVSGAGAVGGLVGKSFYRSSFKHCYASGMVYGSLDASGLVGDHYSGAELVACFWDVDSSGTSNGIGNVEPDPAGVMGKSTSEMQKQSTFHIAGWDFTDRPFWQLTYGDYPRLAWETVEGFDRFSGGSGTKADPYRISNVNDWQEFMESMADWWDNFVLTADLDLSSLSPLKPVGADLDSSNPTYQGLSFSGVFDGGGHVISNAIINLPSAHYVGLFGVVNHGAQIRDLGIENIEITGTNNVGGLAGVNVGTVTGCYVKGRIIGNDHYVGGLVGENAGEISGSYAICSVDGEQSVGGLAGYSYNNISNCYAACTVQGSLGNVGGLVGLSNAEISDCFWDTTISGTTGGVGNVNPDPSGITSLGTAGMQTQSNFVAAGWDFDGVWDICDGLGYPRFQWEIPVGDYVCPYGVAQEDLAVFLGCWLKDVNMNADISGNGIVNLEDLASIAQTWMGDCSAGCVGDVTADGNVNEDDLYVVADQWLRTDECKIADLSGDDFINLEDYAIFCSNWLEGTTP